jgi:hypothetical protein
MPDVEAASADPFIRATAAAIADLHAALRATAAGTADPGTTVGHGPIRLRSPSTAPCVRDAETPAGPDVVEPDVVGHGAIRLLGPARRPSAVPAAATPMPDAAASAGPVGHGTIMLRGRSASPRHEVGRSSEPADHDPTVAATDVARKDLLAALAATD